MPDTSARCEPPEAMRKVDGRSHFLRDQDGREHMAMWFPDRSNNSFSGYWRFGTPGVSNRHSAMVYTHIAHDAGYRYLSPVPSPSEIAALVRAGRRIGDMNYDGRPFDDCDCGECAALRALSTALAAPSFREIEDGE